MVFWSRLQFLLFLVVGTSLSTTTAFTLPSDESRGVAAPKITVDVQQVRQDWIDQSVTYYSKVMREDRRRTLGQWDKSDDVENENYLRLAKAHYFAYRKIRDGKHSHAEYIYRRIIDQIMNEDEEDGHCDHAKLAATTLLLALHCQRMGDMKKTRETFLGFFRQVVTTNPHAEGTQCACSAKVLGAYALFEMKQGHTAKSLQIAHKAVQFDEAMRPVLSWKQFRDAAKEQRSIRPAFAS